MPNGTVVSESQIIAAMSTLKVPRPRARQKRFNVFVCGVFHTLAELIHRRVQCRL